jgi:hypothetical protein
MSKQKVYYVYFHVNFERIRISYSREEKLKEFFFFD